MRQNLGKILAFMLIVTMLITNAIYFADLEEMLKIPEEPKDKAEAQEIKDIEKQVDKNKNKLFDNLEERIAKAKDSDTLPVIVVYKEKIDDDKKGLVKKLLGNVNPKHEYEIIPGMALDLTKGQIVALSKLDFIQQIEYDLPVYAANDNATYWFGAKKAASDFGVDGDRDGNARSYSAADIVVAVIDTGIDAAHVDLDGGKVLAWKDYVNNKTAPYDDNGHGTHCSSTIAGEGDGNSLYKGVAPGAALVGIKVLDRKGSGSMSNVTAGIDWAVQNKATYGIEAISLSLGTDASSDGTDSTSLAVNNAFDNGISVLVAAGNSGPGKYTIGSPGAAEKAITVGAMADVGEKGFNLAYFSSRGPTADGRVKPDIAAPGVNIMAAKANTTSSYISYSGTSMATPFTAGTVALMLDANPSLTPTQVKNTITSTALDWGNSGKDIDYGYGRLDTYAAVKSSGSFSGTNITIPDHMYGSGTINASKKSDYYEFTLDSTDNPIAVTMIMPNWASSTNPDFDVYLYNPSGASVASATGTTRQETINFTPIVTGKYTIRVYSYAGTGSYFLDLSADGSSLILTGNDQ
ncbi:MAG: aprX2 [Clostridia bacterium]|jgi:serine protease AprX|nr:aprX2 [Clostridia bacterium]